MILVLAILQMLMGTLVAPPRILKDGPWRKEVLRFFCAFGHWLGLIGALVSCYLLLCILFALPPTEFIVVRHAFGLLLVLRIVLIINCVCGVVLGVILAGNWVSSHVLREGHPLANDLQIVTTKLISWRQQWGAMAICAGIILAILYLVVRSLFMVL